MPALIRMLGCLLALVAPGIVAFRAGWSGSGVLQASVAFRAGWSGSGVLHQASSRALLSSSRRLRAKVIAPGAGGAGEEEETAYDAVIVGAGVGGLSLAARLASAGQSVLVLEANEDEAAAGRCGALRLRAPGVEGEFRFDSGPSLLLLPDVYEQAFREVGHRRPSLLPRAPLPPRPRALPPRPRAPRLPCRSQTVATRCHPLPPTAAHRPTRPGGGRRRHLGGGA